MKLSLTSAALAAVLATAGAQAAGPQPAPAPSQQVACNNPDDSHDLPYGHGLDHDMPRFGGHGMSRHGGMHGSPLMREMHRLNLSDAQGDAIDAIFVKHHAEQRELFKRRRDLHRDFAKLDPAAKDYASVSSKLADQTGKVAHDEVVLRTRIAAELIATLTPEQVQQLKDDRAKREARRAEHKRGPAPADAG